MSGRDMRFRSSGASRGFATVEGPEDDGLRRGTDMSVKQSIFIEAPVQRVFDFYRDPRNAWSVMPDQMAGRGELTGVRITEDGVGTYYSWAVKVAGLRVTGFDVFTDLVPNERITDRSSSAFVGTWTTTFEPEGSGTRVTEERHPSSSRALRAVDRLTDRVRSRLDRQSLEKAKVRLETEPTTSRVASEQPYAD
jgi:hypothetical protein